MESRFGAEFGSVRIHTDTQSTRSARAIGARAYTVGSNIVFDHNFYAPGSDQGRRLLAHELVHVLQQRPAVGHGLRPSTSVSRDVVQMAVHPALLVALGVVVAVIACALPYHLYAMKHYGHKSDKWRHCWVSCQMAKTCGAILAQLAGLSKEIRDRAIATFCDYYPTNSICLGGHSDFQDSIEDLAANQACIPWESYLLGPLSRLWRESCLECCDATGL